MPAPVVEPRPSTPAERFGEPDDAQDASYFAASARMRSFFESFSSISVHGAFRSKVERFVPR
jgi:hypothetical protein